MDTRRGIENAVFGAQGGLMNVDICITRAIYSTLKEDGLERLSRWTLRIARRQMRLARSRTVFHV